ncbi:hypothetical protein [Streptomyces sp. A5-4]|uniref:hypothetical protein n=1 Tax=Streptomyces sp. A5-4 TaxID=3384771 RepID=UPI003DA9CDB2
MTGLTWAAVAWVVVPLPFLLWLGIYPLWLRWHLKRVGVEAAGECRAVFGTEGRYETTFIFRTAEMRSVYYKTRLGPQSWGSPGEEAVLVHDPRFPRLVRSQQEMNARPEAYFVLWGMLVLEAFMVAGLVLVLLFEAGTIR